MTIKIGPLGLTLFALFVAGEAEGKDLQVKYSYVQFTRVNHSVYVPSNPKKSKKISEALVAYDSVIRNCYTDQLHENPLLRGTLRFVFVVSGRSGQIKSIRRYDGTVNHMDLEACVKQELSMIQFDVEKSFAGAIQYQFTSRTKYLPVKTMAIAD